MTCLSATYVGVATDQPHTLMASGSSDSTVVIWRREGADGVLSLDTFRVGVRVDDGYWESGSGGDDGWGIGRVGVEVMMGGVLGGWEWR